MTRVGLGPGRMRQVRAPGPTTRCADAAPVCVDDAEEVT